MRFGLPLIFPIFALSFAPLAFGVVDLILEGPIGNFVTNNETITVVGYVTSSIEREGVISVTSSAGMRSPPQTNLPLVGLLVDLGARRRIMELRIAPVLRDGLLLAPRRIRLRFSNDGERFSEPIPFNVPSGASSEDMLSVVVLDPPVSFRFVEIGIIEAWQRQGVELREISALDVEGNVHRCLIRSATLSSEFSSDPTRFEIDVPLMPGENRLVISAHLVNPPSNIPPSEVEDFSTIDVLRLDRLPDPSQMKEPIALSDGSGLTVIIPPNGIEGVERIRIIKLPVSDLPSSPILAYDFEALRRVPFKAEATSYLETQPPSLAVDGRMDPSSSWMTGITPMPVEITVDLRETYEIGAIVVHALVEDGKSYGPQQAEIFASSDGRNFVEVASYDNFNDQDTLLRLPEIIQARYIRIKILESKQPNDIRIREIEFQDETNTPIVSYSRSRAISFRRPVVIEVTLDTALTQGRDVEKLALFTWDETLDEWRIIGGDLDKRRRKLIAETTFLHRLALFETKLKRRVEPIWSLNPFSPNGDGLAEVTQMTIQFPRNEKGGYGKLIVQIFDLSGKLVRTLVDREVMLSGAISIQWDGKDSSGRPVPIGPYLYQIRIKDRIYSGVIVVAR